MVIVLVRWRGKNCSRVASQSLCWLATQLAEWEVPLVKGQVVRTGSLLNLYPVRPGSRIAELALSLGRSSAVIGP